MDFKIVAHTDIGLRKSINQDAAMVKIAQTKQGKVCFAAVCDGVGGLEKGELASATVIRDLSQWFETDFSDLVNREFTAEALVRQWEDLILQMNGRIYCYGREIRMDLGTTLTMLLLVNDTYFTANVGDSRIYVLRDELVQITRDQTFIQQEIDEGRMTQEEAAQDRRRNTLLQCVGASKSIEPVFDKGSVFSGSLFLLCSDGFRHKISTEEIDQFLSPRRLLTEATMEEGLTYLTELSKYRGEQDNISAVLIRCE